MLNQLSDQKIDRLASLLDVLADPTRVRIILDLSKPASVGTLERHLQIGQAALSFHLTEMHNNGLLNTERIDGEVYYSLADMSVGKAVKLLVS